MSYTVGARCALFCIATFSALTGCVNFPRAKQVTYHLPDPSSVAGCFNQAGGACRVSSPASASSTSESYFSTLERNARAASESRITLASSAASDARVPAAIDAIANAAGVLAKVSEGPQGREISDEELTEARASILNAVAYDAFDELTAATLAVASDDPLATTSRFISRYLKAYFRSGRFGKATLDPTQLKEKLLSQLRTELAGKIPDAQIEQLAAMLAAKLSPQDFGVVSDESFVARGGKAYQFKEVTLGITPGADKPVTLTKIDGVVVVGEVTRVVFEAMFDARHALPAVANATGIKEALGLIENRICTEEEATNNADECEARAERIVDAAAFERVESIASQIDGATLALTGSYLRGVSWFSLNNEYLATFLETAIAVTARKNAEKVAWCYYTCKPDIAPASFSEMRVPLVSTSRTLTE